MITLLDDQATGIRIMWNQANTFQAYMGDFEFDCFTTMQTNPDLATAFLFAKEYVMDYERARDEAFNRVYS